MELQAAVTMLFEATRPSLPLSPSSYVEYRRQLWAHRGPNVQTKGDSALLPCYQHALTKLGVAKEEDSIAAAAASPNKAPVSAVATPSPTSAAAADPWRVLEVMRRGVRAGAAVVAELIGSSSGIGHMITDSQALLNTGQIIFGIIVIGLIGLISDFLFKAFNAWLFPWKPA